MALLRNHLAFLNKLTRSGMLWMSSGLAIHMFCQWGIAIALAKLANVELLGEFGLAQAVCTPIFFLTNMGLRAGKATDVNQLYDFRTYHAVRIISGVVGLLLVIAAALILQRSWFSLTVFLLVAVTKAVETASDLFYGLLQSKRRLAIIGQSYLLRGPAGLVGFVAVFQATGDLRIALAVEAAVWLAIFLLHDYPSSGRIELAERTTLAAAGPGPAVVAAAAGGDTGGRDTIWSVLAPRFRWLEMRRLAWLSLPLGLAAMVGSLQLMMPRYVIEFQLGTAEVGYFTALVYLVNAMAMMLNSFGYALLTEMAHAFSAGRFREYTLISVVNSAMGGMIGLIAFGVCAVYGHFILTHLYAPEYAALTGVFAIIMASGIARCAATMLHFSLLAARQFKAIMTRQYILTLITAALCVVLIHMDGLRGAAWAMVGSSVAQLLLVAGAIWIAVVTAMRRARKENAEQAGELAPAPPAVDLAPGE
jgi:O-antigen/teichoic acid export membrane protein